MGPVVTHVRRDVVLTPGALAPENQNPDVAASCTYILYSSLYNKSETPGRAEGNTGTTRPQQIELVEFEH